MSKCPNCAALNRDGAKFCTSCGFRMPGEEPTAAAAVPHERSPFSTTSTLPWSNERSVITEIHADDDGNASPEWSGQLTGPGLSWDASPPINRAVPVSDEMIASLLGEEAARAATEDGPRVADEDQTDSLVESDSLSGDSLTNPQLELDSVQESELVDSLPEIDIVAVKVEDMPPVPAVSFITPEPFRTTTGSPGAVSVDSLLKLVREIEYGLIELADAPGPEIPRDEPSNVNGLSDALAALQDDGAIESLRAAISTAQERPRDVDVMLDLVLRADAIAEIVNERDLLKQAIEVALDGDQAPEIEQDANDSGSDSGDIEESRGEPSDTSDDATR